MEGAGGAVLLGARGEEVWRDSGADLLWPAAGQRRSDAFLVVQGSDTNPLGVYGLAPSLVRVSMPDGRELWRRPVATNDYVEDASIYAIGTKYGVLCLQYGVDLFDFQTVDIATGAMNSVKLIDGVPTFTSYYPGPIPEPAGVELIGDRLGVQFQTNEGDLLKLEFDLAKGTVQQVRSKAQPGFGERNPHRDGGTGAARPPLFPQAILPTQHGSAWSIPALVNKDGKVFVATASGASWVTP
jgi:outer membrane protein assembly factor BamB